MFPVMRNVSHSQTAKLEQCRVNNVSRSASENAANDCINGLDAVLTADSGGHVPRHERFSAYAALIAVTKLGDELTKLHFFRLPVLGVRRRASRYNYRVPVFPLVIGAKHTRITERVSDRIIRAKFATDGLE